MSKATKRQKRNGAAPTRGLVWLPESGHTKLDWSMIECHGGIVSDSPLFPYTAQEALAPDGWWLIWQGRDGWLVYGGRLHTFSTSPFATEALAKDAVWLWSGGADSERKGAAEYSRPGGYGPVPRKPPQVCRHGRPSPYRDAEMRARFCPAECEDDLDREDPGRARRRAKAAMVLGIAAAVGSPGGVR